MADNTINTKQDEIIEKFSMLDGDMEMMIGYLMELGDKLPEMPESLKTEDNIVKGCQSKVWLTADEEEGKLYFQADSNTAITKGLVSLLVSILNSGKVDEILNAVLFLLIGLQILALDFSTTYILEGCIAIPIVLLSRFITVSIPVMILKRYREFSPGVIRIMTWGGLRGGISVALALSLPQQNGITVMTYIVVLFSIIVQGLTVKKLIVSIQGQQQN